MANGVSDGIGGEALIGYALDPNLTLGVLSGYQNWDIKNAPSGLSSATIPIEGVVKYTIGTDKIRPFGILGVGVAIDTWSYNSVSTSNTDFLVDPGIGVAINLSEKLDLVILAKVTLDFANATADQAATTNVEIPIQLGLNFGL
jgi:hypothetical protein